MSSVFGAYGKYTVLTLSSKDKHRLKTETTTWVVVVSVFSEPCRPGIQAEETPTGVGEKAQMLCPLFDPSPLAALFKRK